MCQFIPGLSIPFCILNSPVCVQNGISNSCGKLLRKLCGIPLENMPRLCQCQVPALFVGSWKHLGSADLPFLPGRICENSSANFRRSALASAHANPKTKDASHTFKTDNAGGTPGRFFDFVKRLCRNFCANIFCKLFAFKLLQS